MEDKIGGFDTKAYLASLDNNELINRTNIAYDDIIGLKENERNTDKHDECFAGLFVYCTEMNKRGLKTDKMFGNKRDYSK